MGNTTSALVDKDFASIISNKTRHYKMAARAVHSKSHMTQETEKTLKVLYRYCFYVQLNMLSLFLTSPTVCTENFYQVYTIHANVNGVVLPCWFALFQSKNQQTYQIFFREFTNLLCDTPQDILFDFAIAAMNTMQLLLPNMETKDCSFHLSSNIQKHMQFLGLQDRNKEEPEFALHFHMLAALAFAPENNVTHYLNQLCHSI